MPNKTLIAVLTVLAGALATAPTAGATLVCPPGVTNPAYCANVTPPSATTGGATGVSTTSVALAGTVNPNGAATTYSFQYGTTTAYGQTSATGSLAASSTASSVSETIAGLEAAVTYHYRLVASNAGGTTAGADATVTLCPAGSSLTGVCSSENQSGATPEEHSTKTSNDSIIRYRLHCALAVECKGTIYFLPSGHTASAHSAATTIYGSGDYSIPAGQDGTVLVHLTAAGKAALERTGKLTVSVTALSNGIVSPLGTLAIKGKKKAKKAKKHKKTHVTHAKKRPGFTG